MTTEVAVVNLGGHDVDVSVDPPDPYAKKRLGPGEAFRLHIWEGRELKVAQAQEPQERAEDE